MYTAEESSRTWVEVDLRAIQSNLRAVRGRTGKKVLTIVKANAYGHGAIAVSNAVIAAGADVLGVGSIEEALELRSAGISHPILVLGFIPPHELEAAVAGDITTSFWNQAQLTALQVAARRVSRGAKAHLYVDLGMSRFGASFESALALAEAVPPGVLLEGLLGHLPSIDEDKERTGRQIDEFAQFIAALEEKGLRPPTVHVASSSAIAEFPASWFDMVRAGLLLYGAGGPFPGLELERSLDWKTRVLDVNTCCPGALIGYGGEYACRETENIAVIGAGYADGFRRTPKNVNSVLIRGQEFPVVGRVCTQHCMVSMPRDFHVQPGEEVVLIGRSGDRRITADDLAARWKTNAWDVVCNINVRVPRVYPAA